MKCHVCHVNDAQIVFTQILNDEKIVKHICTKCAQEKGLSIEFESAGIKQKNDNVDLLQDLAGATVGKTVDADPDLTCEVCGLSFSEFKSSGFFGCDKCHEAFDTQLKKVMKQIHGVEVHVTQKKRPLSKKSEAKKKVKKLKTKLKKHIDLEEYEKAAEIRDKIAELQKGIDS